MSEADDAPMEKPGDEWGMVRQIIIQCPACNGTGDGERVSREMALDAGCPEREGEKCYCRRCGGSGVEVDIDCFHDEIDEMYEAKAHETPNS